MPLLNVKLLDDGREVDDGEEGAICVTGLKGEAYPPGLFVGYYRQRGAYAEEAVGGVLQPPRHGLARFRRLLLTSWVATTMSSSAPATASALRGGKCAGGASAVVECAVTAAPDPSAQSGEGHHRAREGYEGTDALTYASCRTM